jgi:hypothetical protein
VLVRARRRLRLTARSGGLSRRVVTASGGDAAAPVDEGVPISHLNPVSFTRRRGSGSGHQRQLEPRFESEENADLEPGPGSRSEPSVVKCGARSGREVGAIGAGLGCSSLKIELQLPVRRIPHRYELLAKCCRCSFGGAKVRFKARRGEVRSARIQVQRSELT